ncbi:MAG: hypothetical protein ABI601_06030 [bacterium]
MSSAAACPVAIGLDRTVMRVARALSPSLASEPTHARLLAVAAQLPAAMSKRLYFEMPLATARPRVDLIVGVERASHALLAEFHAAADAVQESAAWARVRALAARWCHPHSVLRDASDVVWLEFDIDPDLPHHVGCPPGVLVDFTASATQERGPAARLALALAALDPLLDPRAALDSAGALRRCLDALPSGAAPVSVGVFLPRDGSVIRLCVDGITGSRLDEYLRAIGWPGSLVELGRHRRALGPDGDDEAPLAGLVHIDIATTVLPRLGIEHRFRRGAQLRGVVAERAFLDRLVDAGLSTAAKREGVLEWPGCSAASMPHELWDSVVLRRLNHVKLTYAQDCEPEAKAYLYATHVVRGTRPSTE